MRGVRVRSKRRETGWVEATSLKDLCYKRPCTGALESQPERGRMKKRKGRSKEKSEALTKTASRERKQ